MSTLVKGYTAVVCVLADSGFEAKVEGQVDYMRPFFHICKAPLMQTALMYFIRIC